MVRPVPFIGTVPRYGYYYSSCRHQLKLINEEEHHDWHGMSGAHRDDRLIRLSPTLETPNYGFGHHLCA